MYLPGKLTNSFGSALVLTLILAVGLLLSKSLHAQSETQISPQYENQIKTERPSLSKEPEDSQLECQVEVISPDKGALICVDSVEVTAVIRIMEGTAPFSINCTINGITADPVSDSTFSAAIPLTVGLNLIVVECTVTDSRGNQGACSNRNNLTLVNRAQPPSCFVEITAPEDSVFVCGPDVEVTGRLTIASGVPPFEIMCEVNGVATTTDELGNFVATVPLEPGQLNTLIATCTIVDSCGNGAVCLDTVVVEAAPLPVCDVEILEPEDGLVTDADSVKIVAFTTITGGVPPFQVNCDINGVAVDVQDDMFMATLPCEIGENVFIATCTVVDSCGNETVCADTIRVRCIREIDCEVTITSPADGATVCGDTVVVEGLTRIFGGVPPFSVSCDVNGLSATPLTDSTFVARLKCDTGSNLLVATCIVVDSLGNQAVCVDSIRVECPPAPVCEVTITTPADSVTVCGDTVTVRGMTSITGGAPPLSISCDVNGIPATVAGPEFVVDLPLTSDTTRIVATCVVIDSCENQTVCMDSIVVFRPPQPNCMVEITFPENKSVVCEDSIKVVANLIIEGGTPPFDIACDINGIPGDFMDGSFMAKIPLPDFENQIIATCTIIDSCGSTVSCADTIKVIRDDRPPRCEFSFSGDAVIGRFIDRHSGIATFEPIEIRNGTLTVEPFQPGARQVEFRIDIDNPEKDIFFSIDVTDVCGNVFNCDPVYLQLSADGNTRFFEFTFPDIDRYFQLRNRGISEIRIALNGERFKLTSGSGAETSEPNTFSMPREGMLTIDLQAHLETGENHMTLVFDGPPGSSAEIFIGNEAAVVDFVLQLEHIPESFFLAQNYPNPFNPTTKIQYDIPANLQDGVQVQLRVYNLLGELVRTLVDAPKNAGRYVVEWDARDDHGRRVSSGIYLYRLTAGEFKQTHRMILLK